jgi:hypothetical protein
MDIPMLRTDDGEIIGNLHLKDEDGRSLSEVAYKSGNPLMLYPTIITDCEKTVIVSANISHQPAIPIHKNLEVLSRAVKNLMKDHLYKSEYISFLLGTYDKEEFRKMLKRLQMNMMIFRRKRSVKTHKYSLM